MITKLFEKTYLKEIRTKISFFGFSPTLSSKEAMASYADC